ncbi:MAG: PD-(D/E)XK nuclease family protein, partial [Burkholderiales bacterium]|nr:PD-(D/E)XK nuclease family protein [Burkholderiales bacterium]
VAARPALPVTGKSRAAAAPVAERDPDTRGALNQPLAVGERKSVVDTAATRYGTRFHLLMEKLTGEPSPPAKEALLQALGIPEPDFSRLHDEALKLLGNPALRRFYDPAQFVSASNEMSLSEGEVMRIDRLVEFADAVWVIDYKTGENVTPDTVARAASHYRLQIDSYCAAMRRVFPGKPVHALLVFSGGITHEFADN